MTVNEALSQLKALKTRHAELIQLRRESSSVTSYRNSDEKITPTYDIKAVDALITKIASEMRKLDERVDAAIG